MSVRYWWVNHGGTFQHEISGGYLWSPLREKTARSQFYDNMALAAAGEIVLSYAATRIRYVGTVLASAAKADKPDEFGPAGDAWDKAGWRLPVQWRELPNPVYPRDIWDDLRGLLPTKYSPLILSSGRGSQKAYLAEVSEAVVRLVLSK